MVSWLVEHALPIRRRLYIKRSLVLRRRLHIQRRFRIQWRLGHRMPGPMAVHGKLANEFRTEGFKVCGPIHHRNALECLGHVIIGKIGQECRRIRHSKQFQRLIGCAYSFLMEQRFVDEIPDIYILL